MGRLMMVRGWRQLYVLAVARWFALSHMTQQVSLNLSFRAPSLMVRVQALWCVFWYLCTCYELFSFHFTVRYDVTGSQEA